MVGEFGDSDPAGLLVGAGDGYSVDLALGKLIVGLPVGEFVGKSDGLVNY